MTYGDFETHQVGTGERLKRLEEAERFRIRLPSGEGHAEVRLLEDGKFTVWVDQPGSYEGGYRSAWNLPTFEAAVRNIMDVLWSGCLPYNGMPICEAPATDQRVA